MDRSKDKDAQVVVVGGGPVGMALAIELGQRGIRCIVVERHRQPQPIPKGQNLTQRTMEHFYFWKAEAALRAARTIPKEQGIGGMTTYGTLLGTYTYDWLQRDLVQQFYFTANERLPQYATEAVLRGRAGEIATVNILYGWSAEQVGQSESGASALVGEHGGSGRRTLHADFVVGCDGSQSLVREEAGITQTGSDHARPMVLLVFRSTGLHRLLSRYPGKAYYNVLHPDLQGYWQFFGRVDFGTTWFFHAPVPLGTTKDNFNFKTYLHKAAGAEFDVEFEHIGFWDLRFAVADSYRAGRLFIAGDAAHRHPPYGGYGVNTGLEDAVNLGWKLSAHFAGWSGEGLLDSYSEERQPVFASTARDFIERSIHNDRDFLAAFDPACDRAAFEAKWKERQLGAPAEVASFEPNYEGSSIVWGPAGATCSAVGSHQFAARAGHHLAPLKLFSGRHIFEELGDGFTLLCLDAGEAAAPQAFVEAAQQLGVPLKVVRDSGAEAQERYEASLVLVRPDQFVAWSSAGAPADATAILKRACGVV
jgi:2-polyprenyl-6-methoxyphenol hydroxylase-like FAD-dependent oxidoreductase